jgi:Tfp pilus assembly protein PilF
MASSPLPIKVNTDEAASNNAALQSFAAGLSGIIAKHKQQTVSIKAARSWQFRAKKSVNESWAKVLKKKGTTADALDEEDAGLLDSGGSPQETKDQAVERRRLKRASLKAEEKAHADSIRAAIVREVEQYDQDLTTNFDELFEKEVVYAVDELRTRGQDDEDESSSNDESGEDDFDVMNTPQSNIKKLKKLKSKRHSLSVRHLGNFQQEDEVEKKKKEVNNLIHGVFWHIFSALERRRARPLETFRTFDKDDSGTITHEEFLDGCGTMGYTISNTESVIIFETLDADGSGELDYRELVNHIKRAGRRGPPQHAGHHKRVHANEGEKNSSQTSPSEQKSSYQFRMLHPGRNKPTLYQRILRADAVALRGGPNHSSKIIDPTVEVLGYSLRIPPAPDSIVHCRRSDVLVGRGLAMCEIGAFGQAQVQFEQAVNADPSHVQAHMQLAALLWKTNRPDAALTHFKTCVKLRRNWPDPLFNCGVVQYRLGRLHHAKSSFQKALELQQRIMRTRKSQRVRPTDDVETQAAHNLVLVERRLGQFRADSASDLRAMKQRQRARKLRQTLELWFERGRQRPFVEEAKTRLKKSGKWPLPSMCEYSTVTSRKYIRGDEPNWEELEEAINEQSGSSHSSQTKMTTVSNDEEEDIFGDEAESSDEETEEMRDQRLQALYMEKVIQSLVSGQEEWAEFPMSIFKQEARGSDLVSNPHLSWAITKSRLLHGKDAGARNSVASVSTSADARVIPVNDHERVERLALRKALVTAPEERTLHQIELLVHASHGFPYLSRFQFHDLRAIWKHLRFSTKVSGDVLFKEGEIPHVLIILLDGRCWLRKKIEHKCGKSRNMTIGKADEGEAVGEDELRRRLPMRTQAVAAQDLELLTMKRPQYESTVQVVNQRDSGAKEDLMRASRAFEGFNDNGKEMKRLALLAQRRHYKNGQVIASIGSSATEMLVVVTGLVHAIRPVHYASKLLPGESAKKSTKNGDEYDVIVATLTQGKCIGTSVVLDPFNPRFKCTYKCATAVEVLALGKEAFELRKITSAVMMSLERASIRSLSIEACTRVIDDKRRDAVNKTTVLRKLKFLPHRRHPEEIEKEWMKQQEIIADDILRGSPIT